MWYVSRTRGREMEGERERERERENEMRAGVQLDTEEQGRVEQGEREGDLTGSALSTVKKKTTYIPSTVSSLKQKHRHTHRTHRACSDQTMH